MSEEQPRPDPGWPAPSIRGVAAALVPGMLGGVATDPTVPAIVVVRRIFLSFLVALALIGLVLVLVVETPGELTTDVYVWALLAVGAVTAIAGTGAATRRRIVCAEPARLARQVSAVSFLGIATANSAALMGFVAAFLIDAVWPYLLSLIPTAVGLARIAPTRRYVADLDGRLALVGCEHSASVVLYALPGDPASPVGDGDDGVPPPR